MDNLDKVNKSLSIVTETHICHSWHVFRVKFKKEIIFNVIPVPSNVLFWYLDAIHILG